MRHVANRSSTLAACVIWLGACGSDDPSSQVSFHISPTRLDFAATANGTAPPAQTIVVEGTGYVGASFDREDLAGYAIESTGTNTLDVVVTPFEPEVPGVGEHAATLTLFECSDRFCEGGTGSFIDVPVTYTVTGASALPAALSFSQTSGGAPPSPQAITFADDAGGSYAWNTTSILYSPDVLPWLTLSASAGSTMPANIDASVATNTLASGTYQASFVLYCAAGSAVVHVALVVTP